MYANTVKCVPLTDFSECQTSLTMYYMVISTRHLAFINVFHGIFLFEFIDKKVLPLKRVTNGKLRFKFSLFVANSEFETSALVWCFIKKCLSDSCESTCADYFKKI